MDANRFGNDSKALKQRVVNVAVVIPFFQRESGILRKALMSVARQTLDDNVLLVVVVVDDSSPSPASVEVSGLDLPDHMQVTILHQENRGPGGARNRALDSLDADIDFVAFLDSDDEWMPDHIRNALRALGNDFDFYFSDFFQIEQSVSAFSRANRIQASKYPLLPGSDSLHIYDRDMTDQIITGNVIGTPTVVMRRSTAPSLRFREEFVSAGEDYLFWLDFVARARGIVFSSQSECRCGRGVNVFSGAVWGTDEAIDRNRFEIAYKKVILREFNLTSGQREHVRKSLSALRSDFVGQTIYRARRLRPVSLRRIKSLWAVDRRCLLLFPFLAWRVLLARARKKK